MKIENPEYIMGTSYYDENEKVPESVVLPKERPGEYGATVVMLSNLKYFLEMFGANDDKRFFRPYEILAELEKQVRNDAIEGKIAYEYFIDYKRPHPLAEPAGAILLFSHFEVNTDTEPDERYRSLYIYYEFITTAA